MESSWALKDGEVVIHCLMRCKHWYHQHKQILITRWCCSSSGWVSSCFCSSRTETPCFSYAPTTTSAFLFLFPSTPQSSSSPTASPQTATPLYCDPQPPPPSIDLAEAKLFVVDPTAVSQMLPLGWWCRCVIRGPGCTVGVEPICCCRSWIIYTMIMSEVNAVIGGIIIFTHLQEAQAISQMLVNLMNDASSSLLCIQ